MMVSHTIVFTGTEIDDKEQVIKKTWNSHKLMTSPVYLHFLYNRCHRQADEFKRFFGINVWIVHQLLTFNLEWISIAVYQSRRLEAMLEVCSNHVNKIVVFTLTPTQKASVTIAIRAQFDIRKELTCSLFVERSFSEKRRHGLDSERGNLIKSFLPKMCPFMMSRWCQKSYGKSLGQTKRPHNHIR